MSYTTTIKNDLPIQGTMVIVSTNANLSIHSLSEEEIKKRLAEELVQELLNNNMVEFTRISQPEFNVNKIFARVCLVPKDIVQILRKVNV